MLASTVNPLPKYLLIVRALAGDSTITRAWLGLPFFALGGLLLAIRSNNR
jgi:hypothetical protein